MGTKHRGRQFRSQAQNRNHRLQVTSGEDYTYNVSMSGCHKKAKDSDRVTSGAAGAGEKKEREKGKEGS